MKFSEIELPSNQKFGLFFSAIFALAFFYFFYVGSHTLSWIFSILSLGFIVVSFILPDILLPLNKLWMGLGGLLGIIVTPIVLGIIFFLIFTPIAFLMRLFGRDELGLRTKNIDSYWKQRKSNPTDSFKNQF